MTFNPGDILIHKHTGQLIEIFEIYGDEYHYIHYPKNDGDIIDYDNNFVIEYFYSLYVPPHNRIWREINEV